METKLNQDLFDEKLLIEAVHTFGIQRQLLMVCEECTELSHAVLKYLRKRDNREKEKKALIDEIADVAIMLRQLELIFSATEINIVIEIKMKYLKSLLTENEEKWKQ
jgi:NTP pyrophosphatase (non-canonical NTP hydrolase)